MSGLCGILQRDGSAEALHSDFAKLLADLADFGITDHCWSAPGVALGQRQEQIYRRDRLECQPVVARNLVLVADARLIEPGALAESVGIPARQRGNIPDSVLILESWLRWGEDALDRLEGDFCFAVWDTQARRLTLARDHLGNRPLYYAQWAGGLAFSTSLSGLPRLPKVDTRLDDHAIADYLGPRATEEKSTPFLGVRRLEAGSVATWTPGKNIRTRRYWRLATAPRIRLRRPEDYPDAVRERVQTIIAHCCDTDHGVGLILSGGLDSSTLAALTARHLASQSRELLTASSVLPVGHRGPAEDERPYIEAVCAQYPNIVPHWVIAPDYSVFADTDTDLRRRGQPPINPFAMMDKALHETLKQAGTRVVIDGLHGDSVWSFEHPLCLLDFVLRGRLRTAWHEWAALSRCYRIGRRAIAKGALAAYAAWLPSWRKDRRARLVARTGPTAATLELARRTRLLQRSRSVSRRGLSLPRAGAVQLADLAHPVWLRLREEITRSGAALGLSLRSPLWDRRVVELCLSAPPEVLVRNGLGRSLAREIGRDIVPDLVRTRTSKGAFLPDFHARVQSEEGAILNELDRARSGALAARYVDVSLVRDALARLEGEVAGRRWTLDAQCVIYRGVKTAAFLRLYESGELFNSSPGPGRGDVSSIP